MTLATQELSQFGKLKSLYDENLSSLEGLLYLPRLGN